MTGVVISGATLALVTTSDIKVNALDGVSRGAFIPMGWSGSFEVERGDEEADKFIASIESDYYDGKPIAAGTMYEYVTEPTGSVSTYQYDGVVFKMSDAGVRRKDQAVKLTLEWFASTRKRA